MAKSSLEVRNSFVYHELSVNRRITGDREEVGERLIFHAEGPGRVVLEREADVLDEYSGALTGIYEPNELTRLRDEWD